MGCSSVQYKFLLFWILVLLSVVPVYILEFLFRRKLKDRSILGRFLLMGVCIVQVVICIVGSTLGGKIELPIGVIKWTSILNIISVSIYTIIFFFHLLRHGLKYIDSNTRHIGNINKDVKYSFIGIIILFLLMPQILFGIIYVGASIFVPNTDYPLTASEMDIFYYPFAIAFSLPISDSSSVSSFQDIVSTNVVLQLIQIIHLVVTKLIELITIGYIVDKLFIVFRRGK